MLIVNVHNVVAGDADAFDEAMGTRLHVHRFEAAIDRLSARYRWVSLAEAQAAAESDAVAALTFDDGYRGVLRHAFPILRARGIPAAVFVITQALQPDRPLFHFEELELAFRLTGAECVDFAPIKAGRHPLDGVKDRVRAFSTAKAALKRMPEAQRSETHARLLDRLGVTPAQCRAAAQNDERFETLTAEDLAFLHGQGWTIGSHTRTHRTLSGLDPAEAAAEIFGSRDDLRARLGLEAMPFAYPYGRPHHVGPLAPALVREAGYNGALTMFGDRDGPGAPPFERRRIDVRDLLGRDLEKAP
ncbi:polysaccharide deacetylase family protein [Azospirillum sp. sgz302134]